MAATRQGLCKDERGIALVMALGIMLVLSISVITVIAFTTSNQRSANYSSAQNKALALAEAGVNNALSVLGAALKPNDPAALTSGSESVGEGTAAYSATLSGDVWTITGTGTVANPTGGSTIVRNVSLQVRVAVAGTAWAWNFSDAETGCMNLLQNSLYAVPLFVRGNLCVANNASFTGARLHVGGTLTNRGSIGSAGSPIESANVVGGCTGGVPNPHPCTAADKVFATSRTQTESSLSKPELDLAKWYSAARPGPTRPCSTGTGIPGNFDNDTSLNVSRLPFELTPATAYSCQARNPAGKVQGELSWVPGSPGTLTVLGTIFFDGNITISGNAVYQGVATIYSSGTVTFNNGAKLCGIVGCTSSWDPATNVVFLIAGSSTAQTGFTINNNAVFQGAAYVVNDYLVSQNGVNWGPVVARQLVMEQNAAQKPLTFLPPGAPGFEKAIQPVPGSWRDY